MHTVKLADAQRQLPELIEEADQGADVPILAAVLCHVFGSARGLIEIADDFDDPIPGFEPHT